ncbi:glycosyltransferase [Escherichia albertii]|nr:glycosyltransferase [Escherichia albertii]MCZ8733617.1 glycosyltransferase [Escherichia albertii]MCZ8885704.1 glycosyltransferase [Escherichia albertii]MCZ8894610.1 glycosyltransferase [Escherichia albertii]
MINIITVNWNNVNGLERTLLSLHSQDLSRDKWKLIVVDGMSTDGSIELLNRHYDFIDKLVIEEDNGVYEAMNKGISHVDFSDYFLFLNSGDVFVHPSVLSSLHKIIERSVSDIFVYYGDRVDKYGKLNKAYYPDSMQYGIINACHQCILYKKKSGIIFDLRYKLFSDLDFTIKYYNDNCRFKYINMPISIYEGGGMSTIHQWKTKKEIYYILFRQFGFFVFFRFLLVKMLKLFGVKHSFFLKKHN